MIAKGVGVHQTALYDMLLAWGLFALLWWFVKQPRREGLAALVFAIYYGCCRLLEDFLRIDKRFGPLTGSQWTALTVVLVCVAIWGYLAVSKRPGPTTPPRTEDPAERIGRAGRRGIRARGLDAPRRPCSARHHGERLADLRASPPCGRRRPPRAAPPPRGSSGR